MKTTSKDDVLTTEQRKPGNDGAPLYLVLADEIRRQINSGSLQPGSRLPSFASVRASRGIAQGTLEKAHGVLEKEGLVERRQGSGVFVAKRRQASRPAGRKDTVRLLGRVVSILTLDEYAPRPWHSTEGWREHITQGAMKAARSRTFHVLTLNPSLTLEQGAAELIKAAPLGLIVSDIDGMRDTDVAAWQKANRFLQALKKSGMPVVAYGNAAEVADLDRVTPDHEEGAYLETRWLIDQGRKRIAMVWYEPCEVYWYPDRRRGYERAMLEAGLEPIETIRIPMCSFTPGTPTGFEQSARYLAGYLAPHLPNQGRVDAIVASTDGDASHCARAVRILGLAPNQDVLFAGYDAFWKEIPEREWEPAIPVVTVDKRNVVAGEEMVRLLMDRIEGNLPAEAQCRKIRPQLIITANDNQEGEN